jgi:hypothetical protein
MPLQHPSNIILFKYCLRFESSRLQTSKYRSPTPTCSLKNLAKLLREVIHYVVPYGLVTRASAGYADDEWRRLFGPEDPTIRLRFAYQDNEGMKSPR